MDRPPQPKSIPGTGSIFTEFRLDVTDKDRALAAMELFVKQRMFDITARSGPFYMKVGFTARSGRYTEIFDSAKEGQPDESIGSVIAEVMRGFKERRDVNEMEVLVTHQEVAINVTLELAEGQSGSHLRYYAQYYGKPREEPEQRERVLKASQEDRKILSQIGVERR